MNHFRSASSCGPPVSTNGGFAVLLMRAKTCFRRIATCGSIDVMAQPLPFHSMAP